MDMHQTESEEVMVGEVLPPEATEKPRGKKVATRTERATSILVNQFVSQIHGYMVKTVENFLHIGRVLHDAKDSLEHGSFLAVCQQAGMSDDMAQAYMKVSKFGPFSNTEHARYLPPHLWTMREIVKLGEVRFIEAVKEGKITPNTERKEIEKMVAGGKSEKTETRQPPEKKQRDTEKESDTNADTNAGTESPPEKPRILLPLSEREGWMLLAILENPGNASDANQNNEFQYQAVASDIYRRLEGILRS